MAARFMEKRPAAAGQKPDALMQDVSGTGADTDPVYDRVAESAYTCHDKKFVVQHRSYERQYAQLYFARLCTLSSLVKQAASTKWPGVPFAKILEVGSQEGQELIAVGTIFKDMKLKPTIMDEYSKDRGMKAALGATTFCCDSDFLVLEDEGGRMALRGDVLPVHQLVTGVVLAVKGRAEPGGDFQVDDLCYIGAAPQRSPQPALSDDKYVAVVSGLGLSRPGGAGLLHVQLAVDWLSGCLGGCEENALASRVVRLVVAGGTVGAGSGAGPGALEQLSAAPAHSRQHAAAMQPVRDMDALLTALAAAMPVDIMPGAEDPTNVALPQQPLHRCLFPAAANYGSFNRVTNPHQFDLEGVAFLGTSGQNVDDMAKYSRHNDRLAMMELSMQWRHLAPTAPDSLTCYPYHDRDPFVLESSPHVYFVGNQPEFGVATMEGASGQKIRLVMVPAFHRSSTVVLINLRTLDCHPISFRDETRA